MAKTKTARKGRSGGVNKSQAIRDYQAQHKGAGPTEVSEALKAQGIDVSPAFVSNVKSTSGTKSKGKRGRKAKVASAETTAVEDMSKASDLMLKAVDLVMKAGAKEAKALVSMAGEMVKRVRDSK